MVIDLYTEQNILIAILGTVGVLTAAFVLTYSFIWQGREELKRKQLRTTNDTLKELMKLFTKAENSTSRAEAQKVLKKHKKQLKKKSQ